VEENGESCRDIVVIGGCSWTHLEPVSRRDRVDQPLWKRMWHLALLLGMVALVAIGATEIIRMIQ
jgi:hypothetical protein